MQCKYRNPTTGVEKTAIEWRKELNIHISTFYRRIMKYGENSPATYLTVDKIVGYTAPNKSRNNKVYTSPCGEYKGTLRELSEQLGVLRRTLLMRLTRYEEDDPRVYLTKEEAEKARLESIRQRMYNTSGNAAWHALGE